MRILAIALFFPSIVLLLSIVVSDIRKYRKGERAKTYYPYEFAVLLFGIPALLIMGFILSGFDLKLAGSEPMVLLIFSVLLAFLISLFWYVYLSWLDLYEREKKIYIIITFILGCGATFLVFPISGLINSWGFVLNGNPNNDFLYSFIGIGLVEEFVKLLPFLIMLLFSKQVDEPYDYVLYASVSALGFAFIENTMYLYETRLTAVFARALYASVAHMFFSSIVAYGLIRIKTVKGRFNVFHLAGLLLLSALAHGFYDFWLISSIRIDLFTALFFVASIHTWGIMKNNLVNMSNFYNPRLKLNSHFFLYRLIGLMLIVWLVGIVGYNLLSGAEAARSLISNLSLYYTFILIYITVSFSSFRVIPGFIESIWLPVDRFMHQGSTIIMPKVFNHVDTYGKRFEVKGKLLIAKGTDRKWGDLLRGRKFHFSKRAAIEGDSNWYMFGFGDRQLLLKPVSNERRSAYKHKLHIIIVKEEFEADKQVFYANEVEKLALAYGQLTDV